MFLDCLILPVDVGKNCDSARRLMEITQTGPCLLLLPDCSGRTIGMIVHVDDMLLATTTTKPNPTSLRLLSKNDVKDVKRPMTMEVSCIVESKVGWFWTI